MKLLVISHTEHYYTEKGQLVGWGSTITELNHLSTFFDEIYHIAVLHPDNPPASALPYLQKNINFIPIKPFGGPRFKDKALILVRAPGVLKLVWTYLKKVDCFQFRAPTGIGVFTIPFLILFTSKKGWFKYAGNWNQQNPPFGYFLQRFLLSRQKRKVTINGKWKSQPINALSFENPCLSEKNRKEGLDVIARKKVLEPFQFCFVGRVEDEKGIGKLTNIFSRLLEDKRLCRLHIVGEGKDFVKYSEKYRRFSDEIVFYGALPQEKVFELYKKCHFLVLPTTASEGFPKVIGEAMNFGCIPVTSNVSSIGQYVTNGKNGFIIEPNTEKGLFELILKIFNTNTEVFVDMVQTNYKMAQKFTYTNYIERIKNEILELQEQ